jgi:DNA mismatch repair protein MutS2
MERKLKQMVVEWRKTENDEDKKSLVKGMAALLFNKQDQKAKSKMQKKIDSKYEELSGEIKPGAKVKMKRNQQVGEVLEIRGKRAVVKIGLLPMQIEVADLVLIKEKIIPNK